MPQQGWEATAREALRNAEEHSDKLKEMQGLERIVSNGVIHRRQRARDVEHLCSVPGCGKWGGFGFSAGKAVETRRWCSRTIRTGNRAKEAAENVQAV